MSSKGRFVPLTEHRAAVVLVHMAILHPHRYGIVIVSININFFCEPKLHSISITLFFIGHILNAFGRLNRLKMGEQSIDGRKMNGIFGLPLALAK